MPKYEYDVFLSHNSQEKSRVRQLQDELEKVGLVVWNDEDQLRPGVPWIELLEEGIVNSASIAVLVGGDGLGPWSDEEMQAALRLAVNENRPVIPVLLPGAVNEPKLPMFLNNRTWVDMRLGFSAESLERLTWGITGNLSPRKRRLSPMDYKVGEICHVGFRVKSILGQSPSAVIYTTECGQLRWDDGDDGELPEYLKPVVSHFDGLLLKIATAQRTREEKLPFYEALGKCLFLALQSQSEAEGLLRFQELEPALDAL